MIYPQLHIDLDGNETIQFIDTDFDDNPFMEVSPVKGDGMPTIYTLLTAFLKQYHNGYEDCYMQVYDDAMEDVSEDDDEDDDEWRQGLE